MKKTLIAALAAALALPALAAAPASAQPRDYAWHGDRDETWDPAQHYDHHRHHDRRMTREDVVWRGHDGHYYCRRSDGSTGLVIGGIAGGLVGNAASHNTLGTLLGVAGGAALGNAIDRGNVHCR